jgi:hypothetical protein
MIGGTDRRDPGRLLLELDCRASAVEAGPDMEDDGERGDRAEEREPTLQPRGTPRHQEDEEPGQRGDDDCETQGTHQVISLITFAALTVPRISIIITARPARG